MPMANQPCLTSDLLAKVSPPQAFITNCVLTLKAENLWCVELLNLFVLVFFLKIILFVLQ